MALLSPIPAEVRALMTAADRQNIETVIKVRNRYAESSDLWNGYQEMLVALEQIASAHNTMFAAQEKLDIANARQYLSEML